MHEDERLALFRTRLKALLRERRMRQIELARRIDMSPRHLSRIVTGHLHAMPRDTSIVAMAEALEVPPAWLRGETDHPYAPAFDDAQQGAPPLAGYALLPLVSPDYYACAGRGSGGSYTMDIEAHESMPVPSDRIGFFSPDEDKRPFLITVRGDSMEDANIRDGSVAVVNPAVRVLDGDAALVCYGEWGEWAIKWVYFARDGSVELRSASSLYPIKRFSAEDVENGYVRIVGRVMLTMQVDAPRRGM